MSKGPTYLLVSLPASIAPSEQADEALTALRSTVSFDNGTTYPFAIPNFKIGTLDALVQQADHLAKLEGACESVVGKVADCLKTLLEGDEERLAQYKTIEDKPVQHYLRAFQWNKIKYRFADKAIADLMQSLQRELAGIDNDVKAKFSQYNQTKTSLIASERRRTGNLSTKSLASIVDPRFLIQDSDYLHTHLLAIPNSTIKDFLKTYESLSPMVVPRSATQIAADDEFTLFAVVSFKKHASEFVHKCREKRWTPREYSYKEGGKEKEDRQLEQLAQNEKKLWGEALRLGKMGYSESMMIWVHVLALRVFVESVLRYGLPLNFVCGLVETNAKLAKKAKASLDAKYSYLGGNAFGRDSKGRIKKDDSSMANDMQTTGHTGDGEYSAYVYYEFEIQ